MYYYMTKHFLSPRLNESASQRKFTCGNLRSRLAVVCVCTIQTNRKHAQVYTKSPQFARVQSYHKSTQVTASWCSNGTQAQTYVDLRSRLNGAYHLNNTREIKKTLAVIFRHNIIHGLAFFSFSLINIISVYSIFMPVKNKRARHCWKIVF
jgi:hypothetical protein